MQNQKIKELDQKLTKVESKIQSTSGKTKTKLVKTYGDLLEKKDQLEQDLSKISNTFFH